MTPQETIGGWQKDYDAGYDYAKVCFEIAPNTAEEFLKTCTVIAKKNFNVLHRPFEMGVERYLEEYSLSKENG
jgi:hypothetical protein